MFIIWDWYDFIWFNRESWMKCNFVPTWLRDISSWPNKARDKMHFVTSVCVKRYIDRHELMWRNYISKSRSYRVSLQSNKEASDVRDKNVHGWGMFGTICKFATSKNHLVTYVRHGELSFTPTIFFYEIKLKSLHKEQSS